MDTGGFPARLKAGQGLYDTFVKTPAVALTTGAESQRRLRARGVRALAVCSDQRFLRSAAAALARCRAVAAETAA